MPGATPRAVGRLCLVGGADPLALSDTARHFAPLVIDAARPRSAERRRRVADRTVLVRGASRGAGARAGRRGVRRARGPEPIVVLNRAPHDQTGAMALPNSPLGARLALGGREARGELGRAIAELADLARRR